MLEPPPVADANLENLHHHLAGVSWCDRQELKYQPTRKLSWSVIERPPQPQPQPQRRGRQAELMGGRGESHEHTGVSEE